MKKYSQVLSRADLLFPLVAVVALPVMIVVTQLAAKLPREVTVLQGGAFVVVLVWAATGLLRFAKEINEALASSPALSLADAGPAPAQPMLIEATKVIGKCPRGFSMGNRWELDAGGKLSTPICQAAIESLGTAAQEGADGETACVCPVAGRGLAFSLRNAEVAVSA